MVRGGTTDQPVLVPDFDKSRHEIREYFHEKRVYDIFDFLLKELMTKQPTDPMAHLCECLTQEQPTGPLKVSVTGPPGCGRSALSRKLAQTFGLEYVSAGELLAESSASGASAAYADDAEVTKLVVQKLSKANNEMKGWVVDGFPRTKIQTSFLKENLLVPTHVLDVKVDEARIWERNGLIEEGRLEGVWQEPALLLEKLRLYACHHATALDSYADRISPITTQAGADEAFQHMCQRVRMSVSKGPHPPPRVVVLGPRGVGAQELSARLAARLGAVLVDAGDMQCINTMTAESREREPEETGPESPDRKGKHLKGLAETTDVRTTLDLPRADRDHLVQTHPLGIIGVRLRQADCQSQGWVLCGYPVTEQQASLLQQDSRLSPLRVAVLDVKEETCVQRLQDRMVDPVTKKVWHSMPQNAHVRQRVVRSPADQPAAVVLSYQEFQEGIGRIEEVFRAGGRCARLPADGPSQEVFSHLTDFAERPLSLPQP